MNDKPDILFPDGGSLRGLARFSVEMSEIPEKAQLHVGAGNVTFLRPTCLILLAKICRTRSRLYPKEKMLYSGLEKLNYANNLGFSQALNILDNPFPQGAFGGKSYIPMSVMSLDSLQALAAEKAFEIGDAIEERCEDISRIVSQDRSAELKNTLARSFCEIFRNTFEHGKSQSAVFCCQYWPKLNTVEICIADRGMGVRTSICESKYTKPENDAEALSLALMPGVSSKAWKHKKKKAAQKTVWDNAGYGLFFAHQIFGKLGHFFIASGESALYLDVDRFDEIPCSIEGTLVSMRMNLSEQEKIVGALEETRKNAAQVKERLGVKSLDYSVAQDFLRSGK